VEQDANETYLGLTEGDFAENPFRRYRGSQLDNIKSEHRQAQLRYFAMPSDKLDITATVYRNEFERNWYKLDKVDGTGIADILENPEAYAAEYGIITGEDSADDALAVKANNREYYSQGVEGILGLNFALSSSKHDVEIGARVHEDEEDRFQHSDGFRMEGGQLVRTTAGVPGLSGGGNNRVNRARAFAGYVQDKVRWRRMNVEAGVRFEHIESERDQYEAGDPGREDEPAVTKNTTEVVVPGVGANYQFTDRVNAFAGVHRGFGPPGPGADEETMPETSVNYEAGVRYGDDRFGGQVLGYFNDYENLLGKDTYASGGTGSGDLFNGGAVDIYGVEASVRSDLVSFVTREAGFAVPAKVTYTYTYGEFKSSFDSDYDAWGSVEAGDQMPYLPEHQLGASLGFERPRWGVGFFGNYMSKMRTVAGQGEIPPSELIESRFVLDGSAEVGIVSSLRAFVSVQNIMDEAYVVARRPAGLRPGMPRQFVVGLKAGI
jgi:Fe(3+) dicitrate transport protein